MTLYLSIIFAFSLILLLTIMIRNNMHWLFKSSLVIGSIFITLMFFHEVQNNLGWPVKTTPPEKFRFVSAFISDPELSKHYNGAIYLWYMDVHSLIPRSIELPYDTDLGKQMVEANRRAAKGLDTYMSLSKSVGILGMQNGKFTPGSPSATFDFVPPPDTIPAKAEDGAN